MSAHGLDSLDSANIEQALIAGRWECDVCLESFTKDQTSWRLDNYGESCCHVFCKACAAGCIKGAARCPWDNTEFPQQVVCGVMTTAEYIYEEKRKEAARTGGVICCSPDCLGVAPPAEGQLPRQVQCPQCGAGHCGRRACGGPWTDGHRCLDQVEEESRLKEEAQRRREEEPQLQGEEPQRPREALSQLAAAQRGRGLPPAQQVYNPRTGCQNFHCRGSGPASARPPRTSLADSGSVMVGALQVDAVEPRGACLGRAFCTLVRRLFHGGI